MRTISSVKNEKATLKDYTHISTPFYSSIYRKCKGLTKGGDKCNSISNHTGYCYVHRNQSKR